MRPQNAPVVVVKDKNTTTEFSTITLASFNAVANLGSIAAASHHLNVAGSVVSRNIKRLEDILEISLFDRSVRGMKLTPAGEYFAAYTRRARLEQEVALTQLRNWSREPEGHIRLSVTDGLSACFGPHLVGEFRKTSPGVTFELLSYSQARTFQALEQGETDLALIFDGELGPNTEILACRKFPSFVLMAQDHPLAEKSFLKAADLARFPFTTSTNSTTRRLLDRVMSLEGKRLDVAMACSNSVAMYNLCSTSQTLNVSCYLSFFRFSEMGLILARDFENSVQLERSVMIAIMRGRYIPEHLRAFIDFTSGQLDAFSAQAEALSAATRV